MKIPLTLTLSLLLTAGLALGTPVTQFEGQLYGPNNQSLPVGLTGTGAWADPNSSDPTTVHWIVTQNPDQSWHYQYSLSTAKGAVSHFIVEVSESFALNDIANLSGSGHAPELADYTATSEGNSNPNLPGTLHGVKFNASGDSDFFSFSFDSTRAPVWGDFYSKDGQAGGMGQNAIWDSGFGVDASFASPTDGSFENKILRPDTGGFAPEPSALAMIFIGGMAALRRRKR